MGHKQLDFRKRCHIYGLWRAGHNQSEIAKEVGVHKSTISRELKRNITFIRTALGTWQYKPNYAQVAREKIASDWSPEQISGYAKRYNLFSISHEWIYQFILKDKQKGGSLHKHLRHQNKKYRKRYGSPTRQGPIKNRRFIDERPEVVNNRSRIGDWEIDTIVGKNHMQAVVSIVERNSKFTLLKKVNRKTAKNVTAVTIDALQKHNDKVFSITGDNGSEFAYHEEISKQLGTEFYFAHPYASWERGLNENTNGLVRQYIKKGACLGPVTNEILSDIMNKLNTRPRKSLGFKSPEQVFFNN